MHCASFVQVRQLVPADGPEIFRMDAIDGRGAVAQYNAAKIQTSLGKQDHALD